MEPSVFQWGMIALALGGAFFLFRAARRVVAWGFFLLYFLIGFGLLSLAAPLVTQEPPPWGMNIAGGFAFASTVVAIKRRIMKIVMAAAVIGAAYLLVHYHLLES